MRSFLMPSEKKVYQLGNGWLAKETKDGARALYNEEMLFAQKRWYDYLLSRKGMATLYSDSWTLARAGRKDKPSAAGSKISAILWNFASLPAGNIGDLLVLGKMFKGDRVLGGAEAHGALGTGATGAYGTYLVAADGMTLAAADSAARFLAATSHAAAGNTALAPTIALGYQFEATADLFVVCVNATAAFATAGALSGHLSVART